MEHIHLTASEKSYLWINYMVDSMAICCMKYYIDKCEDSEIKKILSFALDLSKHHVEWVKTTYKKENIPVPIGFTDEDINLNAPRLFSDEFILFYLLQLGNTGLSYYSKAISMCTRKDVHQFYKECIHSSTELNSKALNLLLNKGLYVRPPYIPDPSKPELIEKMGFMQGFLGKQRPYTAIEISNLFFNLQTTEVVKVLLTGFAQVAKSKDVRDFITRGKEISSNAAQMFSNMLAQNDLSHSTPWYTYVSNSTIAPFSDKLLMFQGAVLTGGGIDQYGFSLATSLRRDIGAKYAQLITEMLTYSDDGMNLMIKNRWMEQPPMATDRENLGKKT